MQQASYSGRVSMVKFWKSMTFAAMFLASSGYALANTPITWPGAELTEGQKSLTCGEARDLLTNLGYQDVTVRSCFTFAYFFSVDRDGQLVRVYVDPENGRVWES
jgi:hypothetical protein